MLKKLCNTSRKMWLIINYEQNKSNIVSNSSPKQLVKVTHIRWVKSYAFLVIGKSEGITKKLCCESARWRAQHLFNLRNYPRKRKHSHTEINKNVCHVSLWLAKQTIHWTGCTMSPLAGLNNVQDLQNRGPAHTDWHSVIFALSSVGLSQ